MVGLTEVNKRWMHRTVSTIPFILVMSLGYAVYAADRTVLSSVLKPLAHSLSLSSLEVGLLGSAQYVGVLCFVFLAGHLSDKYGRWRVLLFGVSIFTCFTWLIGFSTSFVEAFLFRLVSGFGEGVFWPVAMASVGEYMRNRKGLGLGVFYVGFDIGGVAGLSIGGVLYYLTANNWRPAFFVAPTLGIFVILGIAAMKKRFSNGESDENSIRLGRDAFQLLRQRNPLVLMIFAFLSTWASVWQVVFLPYYYSTVLSQSVLFSSFLTSIVLAAGAVGKTLLGALSDFWRRDLMLALISAIVVIAYTLFFFSSNLYVTFIASLSMGFFSASIFPIMQALMTDSCSGRIGTGLGLTTTTQSIASVFSLNITSLLFTLGVGRAIALDAIIPAGMAIVLALILREPRLTAARDMAQT